MIQRLHSRGALRAGLSVRSYPGRGCSRSGRTLDEALTHGLFVGAALALLQRAGVRPVWRSDAVPQASAVLPLAGLMAVAVRAF